MEKKFYLVALAINMASFAILASPLTVTMHQLHREFLGALTTVCSLACLYMLAFLLKNKGKLPILFLFALPLGASAQTAYVPPVRTVNTPSGSLTIKWQADHTALLILDSGTLSIPMDEQLSMREPPNTMVDEFYHRSTSTVVRIIYSQADIKRENPLSFEKFQEKRL